MLNAIVMTVYNNLELTKAAVASALAQDIEGGVHLFIINNGSTDGTKEWMDSLRDSDHNAISVEHFKVNASPVARGNNAAEEIFETHGYDKVLGMPNDVVLPPNFYRQLDRWPRGIVTASMTEDTAPPHVEQATAVNTCTPMCVALIRRWAYDALVAKDGHFFDEEFVHYASDCDFALRLASCGIVGVQLDIPYWHYGSASWKLAPEVESMAMREQADRDRAYFFKKWGFAVGDCQYGDSAGNINFRGERVDGR